MLFMSFICLFIFNLLLLIDILSLTVMYIMSSITQVSRYFTEVYACWLLGLLVACKGVWGVGCGVWGVGYGLWGVGYGVWGMGCGVRGMGFGVGGMGYGVWGMGNGKGKIGNHDAKWWKKKGAKS